MESKGFTLSVEELSVTIPRPVPQPPLCGAGGLETYHDTYSKLQGAQGYKGEVLVALRVASG